MQKVSKQQLAIALAKIYNGTVPDDDTWCELDYQALEYALGHHIERKPTMNDYCHCESLFPAGETAENLCGKCGKPALF